MTVLATVALFVIVAVVVALWVSGTFEPRDDDVEGRDERRAIHLRLEREELQLAVLDELDDIEDDLREAGVI